MKLSPLEIKKQEFARAFRGYDVEEVQAFLQMMSSQWESLLEENRRLEEQVRDYKNKIEHYEKVEEALQDALETARETAKEKVANAEQRAENMIEEAEQKAENIRDEAQKDRYAMKREVSKLKHRREEIVARLRAFLMSEMEMLAQYEEEDPIGFIKFLPQHDEEEAVDDEPRQDTVEGMPTRSELADGPEAPRRGSEESENEAQGGGTADVHTSSSDASRQGRKGPPSPRQASTQAQKSSDQESIDTPSPAGQEEPQAKEQAGKKKQRWRVHSVVSSPPGSKESAQRKTQGQNQGATRGSAESSAEEPSESASAESESAQHQQEEAPSSGEMDKIRRILDELE